MEDETFEDNIRLASNSLDFSQSCELDAADRAGVALFDEWLSLTEHLEDFPVTIEDPPSPPGTDCFARLIDDMRIIGEFARSLIQDESEELESESGTGSEEEDEPQREYWEEPDVVEEPEEHQALSVYHQLHHVAQQPQEEQLQSEYWEEPDVVEDPEEEPEEHQALSVYHQLHHVAQQPQEEQLQSEY